MLSVVRWFVCCVVFVVCCCSVIAVVCCSLCGDRCLLFVVCWLHFSCVVFVGRWMLSVMCCVGFAVYCVLFVVSCLLFAV